MTWKEQWKAVVKWFKGWLHGGPHFVIGEKDSPYLFRWYLLPRNDWLNVYIHKFVRDDYDEALHDHPWNSLSILLWGRYFEEFDGECEFTGEKTRHKVMRSWRWFFKGMGGWGIIWRKAEHAHRIELVDKQPAWTLFITGPRKREWGFHCESGWRHWTEFVRPGSPGEPGRRCD